MAFKKAPKWRKELQKREAAGDGEIRQAILRELSKLAGLPKGSAEMILNGYDVRSDIVNAVIARCLDLPSPDAYRTCHKCFWIGKEKKCGGGKTCPQCGERTHLLPPQY